ncbi:MAG TPA: MFS transporter [Bacteroidales bacterium]|nr:MFS transporter [Bacteroidales bacterium]HPO65504.1 MFS transporter [Bacteroidales bacterium]
MRKQALIAILMVFLAMGFGDVVGPMVSLAKESFSLSNTAAQLLPFVGFLMFGLLSVPVGIFQDRKGKRFTLIIGLIIAFVGLLLPMMGGMYGRMTVDTSSSWQFILILTAILMLGAGATILQVAGNPIMRDVSDEGHYSRNLTLGQTIKALGSSMGFLVPPILARWAGLDWTILFPIYTLILLIALLLVSTTKITERKTGNETPATLSSCLKLLGKNPYVLMMVLGIFFYVGAEVSMSSSVPMLMKENYGLQNLGLIVSWLLFFLPILVGRFTGSIVLRWLRAPHFLILSVSIALIGIVLLLLGKNATVAFLGIVLVGLGFANIFPLIFSIAIDRMPERTNELSGLMITAILGGAIVPLMTGIVQDTFSLLAGFLVPLACILYIGFVALKNV